MTLTNFQQAKTDAERIRMYESLTEKERFELLCEAQMALQMAKEAVEKAQSFFGCI